MEMSQKPSSNCISDLETICGTLENVIKNTFGPRSRSTLMSSNTGHVTLSSDGLTILSSLHLSHPIARCIVKSLDSFVSHNGDGCKTMILYLTYLIRAISKEVGKHGFVPSASDHENYTKSYLSRSFLSFLSVDFPMIIDKMTKSIRFERRENSRAFECGNIIYLVLKSVLDGAAPNEDCSSHLAKVATDYLTDGCATVNDVINLCDWFDNSVYLVPHHTFLSSQTINGILLTSRLFSKKNRLPICDTNFICMQCPIDGSCQNDDSSVVQINSSEVFVGHRHSVLRQFFSYLKGREISLIISLSKFPDFCLQQCQEVDIAVIDCVEETDLLWICNVCKKSPVTSINNEICAVNIINLSSCDKVTFGQKNYVKLVLGETFCHPKSFFICAPSEGICQQLKIIMKRCVKIVSRLMIDATSESNESLSSSCFMRDLCSNIIAGNGYFEMLLCDHLHSYCDEDSKPNVRLCCSLLQKMLMAVPTLLHENKCRPPSSFSAGSDSGTLLDLLWKIHSRDSVNSSSSSLIHQDGDFNRSWSDDVVEILNVKIALVYSTVSLAVNLLRMDKIIGVRSKSSDVSQEYDEPA